MNRPPALLEPLESRTLFSTTIFFALGFVPPGSLDQGGLVITICTHPSTRAGTTLNVTAGTSFTGQVAFYKSRPLDPSQQYSATIAWGDGTTSPATLQYVTYGKQAGYEIDGSHTYLHAGVYKVKTDLSVGPAATPENPAPPPISKVATFTGSANVAPAADDLGTSLTPTAGRSFTATVGSFYAVSPKGLKATINWGDGTASPGKIVPTTKCTNVAIPLNIVGTHTYAAVGTYDVRIAVSSQCKPFTPLISLPATANVTAPSTVSLAGTLVGAYSLQTPVSTVGANYTFNGSGVVGTLGNVSVSGNVQLPGYVITGNATGFLVLANPKGSLTLTLTGPTQAGFSPFPKGLTFLVTSGTGAYVSFGNAGAITASLLPSPMNMNPFPFTFLLTDQY